MVNEVLVMCVCVCVMQHFVLTLEVIVLEYIKSEAITVPRLSST